MFYLLDRETRTVSPIEDDGSGEPLIVQWCRRLGDFGSDRRRVALDDVPAQHAYVSTVFLGMDPFHDAGLHVVPQFFETAVFDTNDGRMLDKRVSATLDEAEQVHADTLQLLRAGVWPPEDER
jgi:hypothetical protein